LFQRLFDGRMGRVKFLLFLALGTAVGLWIGALLVAPVYFLIPGLRSEEPGHDGTLMAMSWFMHACGAFVASIPVARRLRDLGWSAKLAWYPVIQSFVMRYWLSLEPTPGGMGALLLALLLSIPFVYFWFVLAVRPGTPGLNRYG
jgi:uncharacterized membrane protein YhaH (DUF805 family)